MLPAFGHTSVTQVSQNKPVKTIIRLLESKWACLTVTFNQFNK